MIMQVSLLHLKTENVKIPNEIILFLCVPKVELPSGGMMEECEAHQCRRSFSKFND